MKRWYLSLAVLALVAAHSPAQPPQPAQGGKAAAAAAVAMVPMPPEPLCGPMVRDAQWSSDGRYLYVLRTRIVNFSLDQPQTGDEVVLWNASTRRTTVLWSAPAGGPVIHDIKWMPGRSVALFTTIGPSGPDGQPGFSLWRADARRATAAEAAKIAPGEMLSVSPRQPYAILAGADDQGVYAKPVQADGTVGDAARLGAGKFPMPLRWSADGLTVYIAAARQPAPDEEPGDGSRKRQFIAYNAATGTVTTISDFPAIEDSPEPAHPFRLTRMDVSVKQGGESETLHPLWFEQGTGMDAIRVLLAPDCEAYSVAPRGDGILYHSREGAFVVPLAGINAAELSEARNKARRTQVMSQAKQVAMGFFMYSQDNNDTFPGQGDNVQEMLKPYMKSDGLFNTPEGSFQYVFSGGPMSGVKDPVNTVMGYFPFQGQYIIAFMDGHVKTMPTLPPPVPPGVTN